MQADRQGLKASTFSQKKLLSNYVKPQYTWMGKLSSKLYQYTFIQLGDAFNPFFKGLAKYPKFKKKSFCDIFTIDNSAVPIKLTKNGGCDKSKSGNICPAILDTGKKFPNPAVRRDD